MNSTEPKQGVVSLVAFIGDQRLVSGDSRTIALSIRKHLALEDSRDVLVFDVSTGRQVFVDASGSEADVLNRYETNVTEDRKSPASRGRPRLGVVGKEITLLPRHWTWLENQPNGASASLRRLIDSASKDSAPQERARLAQDRTHRFLSSIAGDQPDFEEALRALFASNAAKFSSLIEGWPQDIVSVAREFSEDAFPTLTREG